MMCVSEKRKNAYREQTQGSILCVLGRKLPIDKCFVRTDIDVTYYRTKVFKRRKAIRKPRQIRIDRRLGRLDQMPNQIARVLVADGKPNRRRGQTAGYQRLFVQLGCVVSAGQLTIVLDCPRLIICPKAGARQSKNR